MGVRTAWAFWLSALLCAHIVPGATTITVPDDAPTITAAVALAVSGDTILVTGGPHTEMVTVAGKSLTFEASPEGVIWNGVGNNCLRVDLWASATVRGFVLQGASQSGLETNTGIIVMENCTSQLNAHGAAAFWGGLITADNCIFQDNGGTGIIATTGGHLVVLNSLIQRNGPGFTTGSHGGCRLDNAGTTAVFENTVIIGDKVNGNLAYGVTALSGSRALFRNCTFVGASRGLSAGNPESLAIATGTVFSDCTTAVYADRSARMNVGDLGNADPSDDGGNVFLPDNLNLFENNGANSFVAEGNIFPRIDSAYLAARVNGIVDFDPAFAVQVDRVGANPSSALFATPVPDGQFIELRALSSEPTPAQVDLGGWMVSDDPAFDGGDEGLFVIPEGTVIASEESVLLAADFVRLEAVYRVEPGALHFDLGSASPEIALDPAGDEIVISPSSLGIMDAFLYGASIDTVSSLSWTGTRTALAAEGKVHGRDALGTDTDTAADWSGEFDTGRLLTLREVMCGLLSR